MTLLIIVINGFVFVQELLGGEAFVLNWAAVPANIVGGHHWITLLTAMFIHGSWSHIIGNMIFLWAFGPEIEDAMNPLRYVAFYLLGGLVAMLAQVIANSHSTVPNLGASGAIAAVMGAFLVTYPRDRIRVLLVIFFFVRVTLIPGALLIGVWFLIQLFNAGSVATVQTRSEEHTSELQSRLHLVCRLLLEKKKIQFLHKILLLLLNIVLTIALLVQWY